MNGDQPTEMEVVLNLVYHMKYPCKDSYGNNVRQVYVNMGKNYLKNQNVWENHLAKSFLEQMISLYEVRLDETNKSETMYLHNNKQTD